jgi:hypothetical protein
LKNYLTGWAYMSAAHFHFTTQDGHPVSRATPVPGGRAHHMESARRRWPPVIVAHVGWPLLSTAPDVTEEAIAHSASSPPTFDHTPHCSAPRQPLLRPLLPDADAPHRAIRPGQEECLITTPLLHQETARSTG